MKAQPDSLMPKVNVFPVILSTQHGQTQKQRELQDSFVRSHAAKIAHSKRKTKGSVQRKAVAQDDLETEAAGTASRADLQCARGKGNATHPHPQTILAESTTDPFNADSLRVLSPVAARSLEHVYHVVWPSNSPAMTGQALKSLIGLWRRTAVQSALTFHTQVALAVSLCYCIPATDPDTRQSLLQARLTHQSVSMKLIRETIAGLTGPAPDELIESIMRVAANGSSVSEAPPVSRYRESPINQDFPNAALYGRFDTSPPHFLVLRHLVWERGGLDALHPMTSQPLQLLDVSAATGHGSRPMFSLLKDYRQIADRQQFDLDLEATKLLSTLGQGWRGLQNTQPLLAGLAQRAALLTVALDQTWRAGAGHLPYRVLCLLALVFQHELYSTNASPCFSEKSLESSDELFNIGRLALQVYSEVVLFPLTGVYAARPRLAAELRGALIRYKQTKDVEREGEYTSLLLWAVFMGAVASEGIRLRDWYLKQVNQIVARENLVWDDVESRLTRYLWWEYMFEEHTRDIWEDARSLVSRRQIFVSPRPSRAHHVS